jgi:hypothetical protein
MSTLFCVVGIGRQLLLGMLCYCVFCLSVISTLFCVVGIGRQLLVGMLC